MSLGSYPSAVLFISLGAIYVFAFSVSVSLTRLHRRNIRLMQEVALLEQRVRQLERAETSTVGEQAPAPKADRIVNQP